jgi:hypothetical protein
LRGQWSPIITSLSSGIESEEKKLNRANCPKESDDHFAPALYASLFATKLPNAAHC